MYRKHIYHCGTPFKVDSNSNAINIEKKNLETPENAIFILFDIVGLYPCMPHKDSTEIFQGHLDKRQNKSASISIHLRELATFVWRAVSK